ncbi:hypothetical protein TCAL_00367 [Tigriopus californicus]|uniref:MI domain-containing protein n=1 Tax=Tigriopus californicus TaxID=6832 RepID=A0A553NBS0_TIGCA|nr:nucleolar MIF4G domain-containing protein 1-like [Tigriopus californicus]TRY62892.1 hypothetical protein TCAL_00367 [Tigriopus californicus]|eukprot:TCALIF_00367-PA protein Name:"Similar to NOM1 Nucleolar MIF4G domain-containing protein 1 (Homo sapiens)" AED:0.01 eAED:0.01 QI:0/-1/0/1/-1/1/1/0/792
MKAKNKAQRPAKAPIEVLSRKMKRKNERKHKKELKKKHFLWKRGLEVHNSEPEELGPNIVKAKESQQAQSKAEKAKLKAIQREKVVQSQRKKRLILDNQAEEQNIKQLEKQLKLNKRKKKDTLPKSFVEDGLDYLLDAIDPSKLADKDALMDDLEEESSDEDDMIASGHEDSENSDVAEDEDAGSLDEENDEMADLEEVIEEEEDEDVAEDEVGEMMKEDSETDSDPEDIDKEGEDAHKGQWEDIYGRQRDAKGNVIVENAPAGGGSNKYIPPALRAKMVGGDSEKRKQDLLKLQRKVKGLLNRLAASNLASIVKQIEDLYMSHSRNDMNETLISIFEESLIAITLTPERLIMEHAALMAVLHVNVGMEVGATMIQAMAKKFHQIREDESKIESDFNPKTQENVLLILAHLYSFKVVDHVLIFDIVSLLVESFTSKDIELIVLVLRSVGFNLRKDDPLSLKSLITKIQTSSASADKLKEDSRVKFMLDTLTAIKNNNVKKIPNYDSEHQQFLLKNLKAWIAPGKGTNPLKIHLEELLQADERGRWWIVGSAWAGNQGTRDNRTQQESDMPEHVTSSFSSELLDLAQKMRMNTDARKNIFCAIMTADDYLDAFEKVLKISTRINQREREVAFVLLDCCLQEKAFNPFYAQLSCKFASFDRKYRMALQFGLWDRIKEIDSLGSTQVRNLAGFTHYVLREGSLSIACLKVVEFAELNKPRVKFLKLVLGALLGEDKEVVKRTFSVVGGVSNLRTLREGLRLFLRHFLLKSKKDEKERNELLSKIRWAETAMMFEV